MHEEKQESTHVHLEATERQGQLLLLAILKLDRDFFHEILYHSDQYDSSQREQMYWDMIHIRKLKERLVREIFWAP